jgi:hypothetical protein
VAAEHCRALLVTPPPPPPQRERSLAAASAPAEAAGTSVPVDPRRVSPTGHPSTEGSPVPTDVDAPTDAAAAGAAAAVPLLAPSAAPPPAVAAVQGAAAGAAEAKVHPWAGRPWLDHEGNLRPDLWAMLTRQVQTLVARAPGWLHLPFGYSF